MPRNKLYVGSTVWVDVILFDIFYFIFWGRIRNSEDAMGGDAPRTAWRVNKPKKTGAWSTQARTRSENPLVVI